MMQFFTVAWFQIVLESARNFVTMYRNTYFQLFWYVRIDTIIIKKERDKK
jgi:hypothetical protein